MATILVIIALAVLPLLTPPFTHAGLALSGSAAMLGLPEGEARGASDRSVAALIDPAGSFDFEGPDGSPFYDAAEQAHLRDARLLLWLFLGAGLLSAAGLGLAMARAGEARRRALWQAVSRAGATVAVAVVVIGVIGVVAFDQLFTLFHEVFFPGGNWAFDAATQRLVQLYPYGFWQLAATALGLLVLVLATGAWWLGRRLSRPGRPAALGSQDG